MRRLLTVLLMLMMAALVCFAGACGSGTDEARRITVNEVTRSVFYAPFYAAITKGFFIEEGLDIEVVTSGGSDKSMTALLAGEAEFALMGPETGVYVVGEGKADHPVIIAQVTKRDGSFLVGRAEEPEFSWESLRGSTVIGGRPGGMPYMTLCYVLRSHGLEPGVDVTVIDNIAFPLMGGAFDSGTGDYVTLFEPTASQFQSENRGFIVANVGMESGEVPYTTFMTSPDRISEEPELVEAFVRAVYKGQKWCAEATDAEIADAMQPYFPDSTPNQLMMVAKSYRATDSWMTEPMMTEDSFLRLLDIMRDAGVLTADVAFNELVDNSFGESAVNES